MVVSELVWSSGRSFIFRLCVVLHCTVSILLSFSTHEGGGGGQQLYSDVVVFTATTKKVRNKKHKQAQQKLF